MKGVDQLSTIYRHLGLLIVPAIGWYAAHQSRPTVMSLFCSQSPDRCQTQNVPIFDQVAIGSVGGNSDYWSFATQYLAGVLALVVPLAWNIYRREKGWRILIDTLSDWSVAIQTTLWNGIAMETTRLLVQRPRPFVYQDPLAMGLNPAHYTSFYSGHTSFAAAAGMTTVLFLVNRSAPRPWIVGFWIIAFTVTLLTGILRVAAGRHFPSDVVAGALAGILVAWLVRSLHESVPNQLSWK